MQVNGPKVGLAVVLFIVTFSAGGQEAEHVDRVALGQLTVDRLREAGADPQDAARVQQALEAYERNPSSEQWAVFSTQATNTATERGLILARKNFIAEAALRLRDTPAADQAALANFRTMAAANERALLETNIWKDATEKVRDIAHRAGARSLVTFKTANPGATVKYQTVAERLGNASPKTIGRLTTGESPLAVAYYFMWTERNGLPTSSLDAQYPIINKTETVEFAEQLP